MNDGQKDAYICYNKNNQPNSPIFPKRTYLVSHKAKKKENPRLPEVEENN